MEVPVITPLKFAVMALFTAHHQVTHVAVTHIRIYQRDQCVAAQACITQLLAILAVAHRILLCQLIKFVATDLSVLVPSAAARQRLPRRHLHR